MRTNSLKLLAAIGVLFLATTTWAQQAADNKGQNQKNQSVNAPNQAGNRGDRMCEGLDLTDAQKEQIKPLKTAHMKKMMTLKNELAEKEARLNTLESADNADMKAINSTIDEIGVIKTNMAKERAAHQQGIRKLLTEEQRLQFDLRHDGKGNRGGNGEHKGYGKHDGKGGKGCNNDCPNRN